VRTREGSTVRERGDFWDDVLMGGRKRIQIRKKNRICKPIGGASVMRGKSLLLFEE